MAVVDVFADAGQIAADDHQLPQATIELARRVGLDQVIDATTTAIGTTEMPADPFSPEADRLLDAAIRAQEAISDMALMLRRRRRIVRWNRRTRDRQYRGLR